MVIKQLIEDDLPCGERFSKVRTELLKWIFANLQKDQYGLDGKGMLMQIALLV